MSESERSGIGVIGEATPPPTPWAGPDVSDIFTHDDGNYLVTSGGVSRGSTKMATSGFTLRATMCRTQL